LPGLSHLENFSMSNRLATMTDKSAYHDQWQAFNPTHLPGLLFATPPSIILKYCLYSNFESLNHKIEMMKKTLLLTFLLTISWCAFSQDKIFQTNGQIVNCKVLGIDSSHVYFTMENSNIKSSLFKGEIRKIQYGNPQNFKNAVTFGFLEGGGSLVGFDCEMMLSKSASFQVGAGIIGFGLGINKHFKPSITSSFLSLQYWHQGFGNTYTQSLIGPSFVFRAKKIFSFQIGLGYAIEKGPAWPVNKTQPPIMLTYAIGGYIPF